MWPNIIIIIVVVIIIIIIIIIIITCIIIIIIIIIIFIIIITSLLICYTWYTVLNSLLIGNNPTKRLNMFCCLRHFLLQCRRYMYLVLILFTSTAQFYRYFKTLKERDQRIKKGKNEEHKEKCKRNRRLLNVSFTCISIQK